jgi:hypothetical protein
MGPKAVSVLLWGFGVAVLASAEGPVPEPLLPESFAWFSPVGHSGLKAAWVVGAEQAYVAPANQPHQLWARDGAVAYQESGVGPTGTVAVAGN